MDKVEIFLKDYSNQMNRMAGTRKLGSEPLPDPEELVLYCQDRLEGKALERFERSLAADRWVQDMVLEMKQLMQEEMPREEAPPALVSKAKRLMASSRQSASCPHCGKTITPFKRSLQSQKWSNLFWLVLMAAAFALSFVVRRYFMQFLAVSLIAGVKWAVEMRASKTQIMIYKALSDEGNSHGHRLREFQEKE